MKSGKPTSPDARVLRQRAEQKLREHQALAEQPPSEIDARALVHELQVHQIELEMQNEELDRAQAQTQEALDKYIDLFDFAPLGYFRLTQEGVIREANLAGAALLGLDRSRGASDRQEALDKYIDLFDFAPLGYFRLTQEGVIREANLAGAALLGLDRSRVVSARFGAWVAPACLQTFATFCKVVLASDTKQSCEIQLLCQGQEAQDVRSEDLAAPDQADRKS